MSVSETLAERASTHGDYRDHAHLTQSLKTAMRAEQGWKRLTCEERESLEMIAHKIGRILAGNPHYRDHWIDIAGYAQLVADRCEPPAADDELARALVVIDQLQTRVHNAEANTK